MRALSVVFGSALGIDVGRAVVIALSVFIATALVRVVWSWLMRSARDDFRESIGKVVDEKIGSLQSSLQTMATDLGDLASALREEREERADIRAKIEAATEELREGQGSLERKFDEKTGELRLVVARHDRWLIEIAAQLGIELDLEDFDPSPPEATRIVPPPPPSS